MKLTTFNQMDVWKKAHDLTLRVFRMTNAYPPNQRFGLVSQMQRAAVSIPSNIAEGFVAPSGRERGRYYAIARCSAEELRYQLILSRDLGFVADVSLPLSLVDDVSAMLFRLRESVLRT